ncbi:HesA/MoeB/ThiF family protein [Bdellovibrio svalbardensis]|uniref:ThiF family adenylyltransferase n=1 Tax=Bdellovibrio svalbardensis TaxID=2972972 RepID=A0ABT6DF54_9BACT|nr:ThiF family adenylyltransferase [Bdellovibrio svalbardensis]MDG0815474.1 ThiF family adenylyltransferase [Bdellovibrio svalbardensis]
MFSYDEFVTRNLGFITEEEQAKLRQSTIFIPGVGGMGGAALACLARCGVGKFIIADIDTFEVSNFNRQIFSNLDTVGESKAEVSRQALLKINPELQLEVLGGEWPDRLSEILPKVDLVINGCDDVRATLLLMRAGRDHGKTVIDAFASTLPNVYVVRPSDPRPEEFLRFPSVGLRPEGLTDAMVKECSGLEMEYVLTHSSTSENVVLKYAAEMITGKRKRISLAPMVWGTGIMMSYEALKILLNKKTSASHKGIFWNPWKMRVEKPLRFPLSVIKRSFVRKFLQSLAG